MTELKGRPWFFKGVKNVTDCETAKEVISSANLNFHVSKCPLVAEMPAISGGLSFASSFNEQQNETDDNTFLYGGAAYRRVDNAFATYRTDTNKPLGLVKSKYEIVQNIDAFNFFDDAIGEDKAIWDTAGCFDGGKRIFVSAKLPVETKVNGKDHIQNYLVFTNSHDGSSGVNIMFTSIRMICQNCLPGAKKDGKNNGSFLNFRHTESIHCNINQAIEILGFARRQAELMEVEYNKLAMIKMNETDAMDYFAKIHMNAEEYSKMQREPNGLRMVFARDNATVKNIGLSTKKLNILTNTMDYYHMGEGQREFIGTGWGAFNAITGYYSNLANFSGEKRMDSILYGNAGNVMSRALSAIAV